MKRARTRAEDFTIAWVCALPIELSAATVVLDEQYDDIPELSQYVLGRIGLHNVVITCLPAGQYGTNSAAVTAADLQSNFLCVKYWLVVGIGGGVPSLTNDIRLGDVVVAQPQNQHGGVIQYDLVKTGPDGHQVRTGVLNAPPATLGRAVSRMRSAHDIGKGRLRSHMSPFTSLSKFQRSSVGNDILFMPDYQHNGEETCQNCLEEKSISRVPRDNDDVLVHFGLIASGNQVIKDGATRDKVGANLGGALCFEMEAAGLVNNFPCLVIRGICDYADSHKNKKWQPFAASSAAACAKEILSYVPSTASPTVRTSEQIPDLYLSEKPECVNTSTSNPENSPYPRGEPMISASGADSTFVKLPLTRGQQQQFLESLTFENINARHANIRRAHAKTCQWLLKRPEYLTWLNDETLSAHHGFFWIKGHPGSGKSTILKYVLANVSKTLQHATVLSFFFNARGDELEKSTLGMYRSILFQLLERLPDLQDVFTIYRPKVDGINSPQWDIDTLKGALEYATERVQGYPLLIFVDALDECEDDEILDMVAFFERLGETAVENDVKLRTFFSSRHYPHIAIEDSIELILETQDDHEQDIAKYLQTELKAGHSKFVNDIRTEILQRSSGIFLWVVLVVQILNKDYAKGNKHTMKSRLSGIPDGLEQLFEDILSRDSEDTPGLVLCLQLVLFAHRPLTAREVYIAMTADIDANSITPWNRDEVDSDDVRKFLLNTSKGLAEETKAKSKTVQFIHESVRDFFLRGRGLNKAFFGSVADFEARSHERLKQCCHAYFIRIEEELLAKTLNQIREIPKSQTSDVRQALCEKYPFFEYAVKFVLYHSDQAERFGISQKGFLQEFPRSKWIMANNVLEPHAIRRYTSGACLLYIFAENDLPNLVKIEHERVKTIEVKGERYRYPIFAAAISDSKAAVRSLLVCHLGSRLNLSQKELDRAVLHLMNWRATHAWSDEETDLLEMAVQCGLDTLCQSLLPYGDLTDALSPRHGQRLLMYAFDRDCTKTVIRLIEIGRYLNLHDNLTSIFDESINYIVRHNDCNVLEQLLAQITDCGTNGDCAVHQKWINRALESFAHAGRNSLLQVLLAQNPRQEAVGSALVAAAGGGYLSTVQLVLQSSSMAENGASGYRLIALIHALDWHHTEVATVLFENDLHFNEASYDFIFLQACCEGHTELARAILEKDRSKRLIHRVGSRAIVVASKYYHPDTIELLFSQGAEFKIEDLKTKCSWPPRYQSDRGRHRPNWSVERCMQKIYVDRLDLWRHTNLTFASDRGYIDMAKSLIAHGADIEQKSQCGRTALFFASAGCHLELVQLLLDKGAKFVQLNDPILPNIESIQSHPGFGQTIYEAHDNSIAYALRASQLPDRFLLGDLAYVFAPFEIGSGMACKQRDEFLLIFNSRSRLQKIADQAWEKFEKIVALLRTAYKRDNHIARTEDT